MIGACGSSSWRSSRPSPRPDRREAERAARRERHRVRPCTGSGPRRRATSSAYRKAGPTGPTIYVFSVGPWQFQGAFHLSVAKVVGRAAGGDPRRRSHEASEDQAVRCTRDVLLIPVSPLRSHAHYTATVTVAGPNDTLTKTWHFTTA
jgi:hypothetical protein